MAWRGYDLAAEWRNRRWRRLLNLIDHLPRSSHYVEALSQDEDLARAWLDVPVEDRPQAQTRLSEFNPDLSAIHDRLAELVTVLINVNSKSGGHKPHYMDKPETAIQRLEVQRQHDLVHEVMGGWMD